MEVAVLLETATKLAHWTKEEKVLLTAYYPTSKPDELQRLLPSKTRDQIKAAAYSLHIRKCAETRRQIAIDALRKRHDTWTERELELLALLYPVAERADVLQHLPSRSWETIRWRAKHSKIRRNWTVRAEYEHLEVMPETDKAWLAAALDFEGTIGIAKHGTSKHGPVLDAYLSISNTNLALIDRFTSIFKSKRKLYVKRDGRTMRCGHRVHKPVFQAMILRMPLIFTVLRVIRPYLVAKGEQADIVLRFLEHQNSKPYEEKSRYTPEQLALYNRSLALNSKGIPNDQ